MTTSTALNERFTAVLQKSPAKGMALGDGTHKFPLEADLRRAIGNQAGDTATVQLDERLDA